MSAIGEERVIRPGRPWYDIDASLLLHYRDLLFLLVRRDLVSRYRQTILGPAWFILQPLITTGIFTFVFSQALGTSTDGMPAFLFYQCGMLGWSYFSTTWQATGNIYTEQAAVMTKVYFPRMIMPVAYMISSLASLGFQILSFLVVLFIFRIHGGSAMASLQVNWHALLGLPLIIAEAGLFGLGLGFLTSSMSAKYRDLNIMVPFLIQISMFVTPVIYPLSQLGARARMIAAMNPVTMVVEAFRLAFFGRGVVTASYFELSAAVTLVVLAVGFAFFQRAGRTFADTV